jgi:NAD(P)-dependent dehydrogenase (short-subunit alcohol dehydrogenase family)
MRFRRRGKTPSRTHGVEAAVTARKAEAATFFPFSVLLTRLSGKIGQELVKILAAKGAHVTVLARDPAKVKVGGTVSAVKGDVTDLKHFGEAAKGHDRLFLLTNSQNLEVQLAHIARDAGVKHIVRISCWLAAAGHENGSIFQQHGRVELELEKLQNIAVTTLRPSDFMQNFFMNAASVKDPNQRAFYHNASDARVSTLTVFHFRLICPPRFRPSTFSTLPTALRPFLPLRLSSTPVLLSR